LESARQDKAIIHLGLVAYVLDLQVMPNTINNFIMSEAVQIDTNALLKAAWHKMNGDVVRENQQQLVAFATGGVAIAMAEYPFLTD